MVSFSDACIQAVKKIADQELSLLVLGNTESKYFPQELLPYAKPRSQRSDKCPENGTEKLKVNFLVNYGPEWDIEQGASREISAIDLVLRWGGMRRLSGFLPMQTVYADIYVTDVLWPDYDSTQLDTAMNWYQKQDVTKGGEKNNHAIGDIVSDRLYSCRSVVKYFTQAISNSAKVP